MATTTTPARTALRGPLRARRGTAISCRGWQQEAALRMLLNNLDPEVAERPEELVVYGGSGKAARNWECLEAIVATLQRLAGDERSEERRVGKECRSRWSREHIKKKDNKTRIDR